MNLDRLLYFIVELCSFGITFVLSFLPRYKLIQYWKDVFTGIFIVAIGFVIWDVIFTKLGVWSFSDEYTIGFRIMGLPVEEILFFIFIPYACVFTYYSLKQFIIFTAKKSVYFITLLFSFLLLTVSIYYLDKIYTSITFGLTGFILIILSYVRWKHLLQFYVSYIIILFPFFMVNGILTGGLDKTVVSYNSLYNLNIKIYTIPIEDVFYGFLFCILNVVLFERAMKNKI